jgi:hypothetical protein
MDAVGSMMDSSGKLENIMNRRPFLLLLALPLAIMACIITSVTGTPETSPTITTEAPGVTSPIPATPSAPALPPTSSSGLTLENLRNATYDISAFFGSPLTITLVNGSYLSGSDPAAVDYMSVNMGDMVAFGDLNYDGLSDAAVILAINTGGTGVFTNIASVLDNSGAPSNVASIFIDDRPIINSLAISNGEILADIIIHGSTDPGCCPGFQTQQGFRLYGSQMILTRRASWLAGTQRAININSPADLAVVTYPLTISGSVTVGPFENTLAFKVYTPDNTLVTNGPVMTDSPDAGEPGNFSHTIDLSMAGVYGLVRIEFAELSMKDGSIVTLDSVLVNVH